MLQLGQNLERAGRALGLVWTNSSLGHKNMNSDSVRSIG